MGAHPGLLFLLVWYDVCNIANLLPTRKSRLAIHRPTAVIESMSVRSLVRLNRIHRPTVTTQCSEERTMNVVKYEFRSDGSFVETVIERDMLASSARSLARSLNDDRDSGDESKDEACMVSYVAK